ncbi:MAG: peptide chain release factor N(5)-glutamine methyltransferase, partial [Bacteroidia bacterium]|nr:peptide chain release factor N(5)-glutamine methyltransferase [Bacteroidia bacterium]
KLKVNPAVLIPRPETEELVDWIVKEFKVQSSKFKVLDVGTGSGCIALALKRNIPSAEVFALDISEAALDVAKQNALNNSLEITFVNASIIENWDNKLIPFGEAGRGLSLIVSNPPYVLQSEKHAMQPNVLVYEPHLALFVNDNDPLLFYKAIIEFAKKYLANKGRLFFEINEAKADEVKSLLVQNGFKNVEIKKDLSGKERMVKAEK